MAAPVVLLQTNFPYVAEFILHYDFPQWSIFEYHGGAAVLAIYDPEKRKDILMLYSDKNWNLEKANRKRTRESGNGST
jgi:hypothetical protein